jgi:hypothetical protein
MKKEAKFSKANSVMVSLLSFLTDICPNPTHAVTITFSRNLNGKLFYTSRSSAERAILWFINRLNKECFRHGARRKGYKLGVITFLEKADTNIHAHLALVSPEGMSWEEFAEKIVKLISKSYFFGRQCRVSHCKDIGWLEYISKEGSEALIPSCTSKAFP